MKIKPIWLALLTLVIIFGGIGIAQLTNLWSTDSGEGGNGGGNGRSRTVEAGEYDPDEIRGSFSFETVSVAFEIEPEVLLAAFGLPTDLDPADLRTGDLEALYEGSGVEVGNGSVKMFVALYKNLPIEIDVESFLPIPAVEAIRQANPNLTTEQAGYLLSNEIDFLPIDPIAILENGEEDH